MDEVATSAYEHAFQFRKMFGLDTDPDLIVLSQSDSRYSSSNYGVPLSIDEENELQRRVQLEWDSHPAVDYASAQPTWAGYYIDQLSRGAPVFLTTGDDQALARELEHLLPRDSGFRVKHVEHTLKELQDVQSRIVAAWDEMRVEGINVTHTGIDLLGNAVTVGIDGLTDSAIKELVTRFGQNIKFADRPAAVADACPYSNCLPMKAGLEIDGAAGYKCTAGFIVRRELHGAPLSALTAGHCAWVNGPAPHDPNDPQWGLNGRWKHGTTSFGDSKYAAFFANSLGDVTIVEIDTEDQPSPANKLFINNGSTAATYTVTNYVPDSYQTVGAQACAYGYKSNNSECIMITDADETNQSCVTLNEGGTVRKAIQHTKEYNWNLIGGDSGGPIYQVTGSTTRSALGLHVHSEEGGPGPGTGWYTPLAWALVAYEGVSGGEGFMICTTSSC